MHDVCCCISVWISEIPKTYFNMTPFEKKTNVEAGPTEDAGGVSRQELWKYARVKPSVNQLEPFCCTRWFPPMVPRWKIGWKISGSSARERCFTKKTPGFVEVESEQPKEIVGFDLVQDICRFSLDVFIPPRLALLVVSAPWLETSPIEIELDIIWRFPKDGGGVYHGIPLIQI